MLAQNPEVARYFRWYKACVQYSITQVEVPKDGGKKTQYKMISFPVGYGVLPYEGGWLDQPHRMVSFWNIFLEEERLAAAREIS